MAQALPAWLTNIALPWLSEEASIFGKGPLVVADIRDAARLAASRAELATAILVGVDPAGALPDPGNIFDILLTTAEVPPTPWVQVRSLTDSLLRIEEAVRDNPDAAVTLVQVLRAQRGQPFEQALMIESFAYSTLLGGEEFRRWRAVAPHQPLALENAPAVAFTRSGATARLTLSRPGNGNALTAEMRDALVEALRVVRLDDSISDVEIAGEGRVFCSGGALGEFGQAADLARAHQLRTVRSVAWTLHRIGVTSRVMIQGAAVGGGVEFAAAASEIVAHSTAFFQLPEISMGLIPGAGGTVTIARRIGYQRTAYLALSGIRLRARTALAWGLVDRVSEAVP